MIFDRLSIDPRGEWSPVKAVKVLEVIQPEAAEFGLRFKLVDISTIGGPERVLLILECVKHWCAIPEGSGCPLCNAETHGPRASPYGNHVPNPSAYKAIEITGLQPPSWE